MTAARTAVIFVCAHTCTPMATALATTPVNNTAAQ